MAAAIPDHLLEDIFLRLDDAADLVRAAAACASFRGIILSDKAFRRRFRSLHPPPILGFFDSTSPNSGFHPAQPPHRLSPAARAFAAAADFTFSFLADDRVNWRVRDVRDDRVLLARPNAANWYAFDAFLVCDPLHRRYLWVPAIPGDLLPISPAAAGHYGTNRQLFEPLLAPAAEEDQLKAPKTPVHVICNVLTESVVVAFMYSSATKTWQRVASFSTANYEWMKPLSLLRRHYASGRFYLMEHCGDVACALDTRTMQFSVVHLPPECSSGQDIAFVETTEDRISVLIRDEWRLHLYSKAWRRDDDEDDGSGEEWRHDSTIRLPYSYWWSFSEGSVEGSVILKGKPEDEYNIRGDWANSEPGAKYFIVDTKTLSVESLYVLEFDTDPGYLYASFPPGFSPPSI